MARPSDPNVKIDLLRAAETVFLERGLEKAKIEEITERAGTSKGAFYSHFPDKESAFRQIVETMLARLCSCIEDDATFRDPKALSASGHTGWLDLWLEKDVEIFDFIWQNRRVVRILLEGGKSAQFAYLVDAFAERCRSNTKRFLEWGKTAGFYRADLDVELGSLLISGAYDRVARELVKAETKPDLRLLFHQLQQLLIGGLGTPAARAASDRLVTQTGQGQKRTRS